MVCQRVWLACWLDALDGSSSSSSRGVQDVSDVCRDEFEVVLDDVVLEIFGLLGVGAVLVLGWTH